MQTHVFTIAHVCHQFGVKHAVISPGSRSAPLVYAFLRETDIHCHSVPDERSAGFVALGLAQQLQIPTVLICTSGTAVANYYPAVAEAFYQKIPLLILSADRPPELLDQQDGQMIRQKEIFEKHVLGSYELPCYEEENTDHQATANMVFEALAITIAAKGAGPVHINVPLREPLYDIPSAFVLPSVTLPPYPFQTKQVPEKDIVTLQDAWKKANRKLILVGQLPPSTELQYLLGELRKSANVQVIADVVSNQQANSHAPLFDGVLQFASPDVLQALQPDFILSFGGPLVSKALKNWLKILQPKWHFRIQPNNQLINTYQNLTHTLQGNMEGYLESLLQIQEAVDPTTKSYAKRWLIENQKVVNALNKFKAQKNWCEPSAVATILDDLQEGVQLQIANSSSIRWVSWFGLPNKFLTVFGNRGTSGIDGSVSTAVGAALANPDQRVVLLCGDLSLIYDEHAFWLEPLPANLRIVLLDNGGGNIFNWIDGPAKHPEHLHLFTTPHRRNFKTFSESWNLDYLKCEDFLSLEKNLNAFNEPSARPVLLHLVFETETNLAGIRDFKSIQI